jgi:hypothetical protein
MFVYLIWVMSIHRYKTIYVNFNQIHSIKRVRPFNLNSIVSCWVCGLCQKLFVLMTHVRF